MGSFKAVFVLCVIFISSKGRDRTVTAEETSNCECGVFKFPTAEKTKETPMVAKSLRFKFECNADGKASCSNMCVALAGAAREDGPKRICELIDSSETPFVPVVYYRACDDDFWTFTGLKSTLEVCCKNKEVISCA